MGTNAKSSNTTADLLSECQEDLLRALYEYLLSGLTRAEKRFDSIDSKASIVIGAIAVIGGLVVVASPPSKGANPFLDLILAAAVISLLVAVLCGFLCLRIRKLLLPGTGKQIIEMMQTKGTPTISKRILAIFVIDLANSEMNYINACRSKTKWLHLGQLFQFAGIVLLFLFFVISRSIE